MKKLAVLLVAVLLAIGSFAWARHHYVSSHSLSLRAGGGSTTLTNPFVDQKLFGDWIRNELLFAVIIPVAFVAGGVVLAVKK